METYDEDNGHKLYEKYYNQKGGSLPFFVGAQYQRGHGLGGLLRIATRLARPLIRSAVPILKRGAKRFGKRALRTTADIMGDVVEGQNVKRAAKRRIGAQVRGMVGSGAARQRHFKRPTPPGERVKKRHTKRAAVSLPRKKARKTPQDALGW